MSRSDHTVDIPEGASELSIDMYCTSVKVAADSASTIDWHGEITVTVDPASSTVTVTGELAAPLQYSVEGDTLNLSVLPAPQSGPRITVIPLGVAGGGLPPFLDPSVIEELLAETLGGGSGGLGLFGDPGGPGVPFGFGAPGRDETVH